MLIFQLFFTNILDIFKICYKIVIYVYSGGCRLRVIAGKIRGKKLYSLDGNNTRPTTDRVKENIFNIIMPYIYGAKVLDLFAGSGALGIEALSRGAQCCDFVEKNKAAAEIVKKNLCETPFADAWKIYLSDFSDFLDNTDKTYDLIFMDPPYEAGYYIPALEKIITGGTLNDDGIIVMEMKSGKIFESVPGFEIIKEKKYGHTSVVLLKKMGE